MSGISFGGVISGIDWNSIVDQLMEVKRIPITRIEQQQGVLGVKKQQLQGINANLLNFQQTLSPFIDGLINQKDVQNTNPAVLTATAASYAQQGSYTIDVTQLAAKHRVATSNLDELGVATSGQDLVAAGALQAGDQFTINDETLTVGATYSLNDMISAINNAMGATAGNKASATLVNNRLVIEAGETGTGNAITASDIGGGSALVSLGLIDASGGGNLGLAGAASVSSTSAGAAANLNDDDPLSFWQSEAAPNQWAEIDLGAETLINTVVVKHNTITESFVVQVKQGENWITVDARDANSSSSTTHVFNQTMTSKVRIFDADPSDTVGGKLDLTQIQIFNESGTGSFANELTAAQNAAYTINGDPVTEPLNWSNENTASLNGVTLELHSIGTTTLTIGPNTDKIVGQVQEFVDRYNSSAMLLSDRLAEKRVAKPQSLEELARGQFAADFDLMWTSSAMRTRSMDFYANADSDYEIMSQIGVSSRPFASGAASVELDFDESALRAALSDDFEGVSALLENMATEVDSALKTITEVSVIESDAGALHRRMLTIDRQVRDMGDDIARWEDRIALEEQRLRSQFQNLETLLAQMQGQSSYVSAAIQSLSGMNNNAGGGGFGSG